MSLFDIITKIEISINFIAIGIIRLNNNTNYSAYILQIKYFFLVINSV